MKTGVWTIPSSCFFVFLFFVFWEITLFFYFVGDFVGFFVGLFCWFLYSRTIVGMLFFGVGVMGSLVWS